WLALWAWLYYPVSEHPHLGEEERRLIREGQSAQDQAAEVDAHGGGGKQRMRWTAVIRYRQAWAFLAAKFLTDPVWWFYLYWLASYLKGKGISAGSFQGATYLAIPYIAAGIGSVSGGYLSGGLIKRGWPVGPAR